MSNEHLLKLSWESHLTKIPALSIYAVAQAVEDADTRQALHDYVTKWQHITVYTDGYALQAHGLKPGPQFNTIISNLRAAWLDGKIHSEEEEKALLETLIADAKREP